MEKTKLLDRINSQAGYTQGFDTTSGTEPTTLNRYKGKKLEKLLQVDSSKIVDENGEPMVVYHGTNNELNIFETGHGTKGKSFFFTDSKEMARSYRTNVKEVFLNVRDSYEIDGKGRNWDSLVFDVLKTNNDLIKRVKLLRNQ